MIKEKKIVLSLFDGISCGQVALKNLGININKYYASEIEKDAIRVTNHNHPNTIQLGDINTWKTWDIKWSEIDLVMGGSPCQSWSSAGKKGGIKDPRGELLYVMINIMRTVLKHNPNAKFLIENVKMKSDFETFFSGEITNYLGKNNKILINSSLVSPQNRNRYYWTNIEVKQPKKINTHFKDIIEDRDTVKGELFVGSIIGRRISNQNKRDDYNMDIPITQCIQVKKDQTTSPTVTTIQKDIIVTNIPSGRHPLWKKETLELFNERGNDITEIMSKKHYSWEDRGSIFRYLTPIEAERLQNLPDNYTKVKRENGVLIGDGKRYSMVGNGWTVKVIEHIFKGLISKSKGEL